MGKFCESTYEEAFIDLLEQNGWEYTCGNGCSSGGRGAPPYRSGTRDACPYHGRGAPPYRSGTRDACPYHGRGAPPYHAVASVFACS